MPNILHTIACRYHYPEAGRSDTPYTNVEKIHEFSLPTALQIDAAILEHTYRISHTTYHIPQPFFNFQLTIVNFQFSIN